MLYISLQLGHRPHNTSNISSFFEFGLSPERNSKDKLNWSFISSLNRWLSWPLRPKALTSRKPVVCADGASSGLLPVCPLSSGSCFWPNRSEEHTSELQ